MHELLTFSLATGKNLNKGSVMAILKFSEIHTSIYIYFNLPCVIHNFQDLCSLKKELERKSDSFRFHFLMN